MLNTTFSLFDISKKGQTRYACHVMKGIAPSSGSKNSVSKERNVTIFDMFYSGIKKYSDSPDSYVDENEVTILAFHLPQHDFSPMKIWPRKYISDDPIIEKEDAGSIPSTAVFTDTITPDGTQDVASESSHDEGKESYLDYKKRIRKEKKEAAAKANRATPPEVQAVEKSSIPEADLIGSTGEVAKAAEPPASGAWASPHAVTEVTPEKKEKAEEVQASWIKRHEADEIFANVYAPEGENESQGQAILTPLLKEILLARHRLGRKEKADRYFVLDFAGAYMLMYQEKQLGTEEISDALALGSKLIDSIPKDLPQEIKRLAEVMNEEEAIVWAVKSKEERALQSQQSEEESDPDYPKQLLREYLEEQKLMKGLGDVSDEVKAKLMDKIQRAELILERDGLTMEDVKAKYREVEGAFDKAKGQLYDGGEAKGEAKGESSHEAIDEGIDHEVEKELAEDAGDDF